MMCLDNGSTVSAMQRKLFEGRVPEKLCDFLEEAAARVMKPQPQEESEQPTPPAP
jgi:hypothetical protein